MSAPPRLARRVRKVSEIRAAANGGKWPRMSLHCCHVLLSRAELAELCDPANYLGQSGVMVDRVLSRLGAGA